MSEIIRKCGYCKNFETCRGTNADDTPESMRCIAFDFNPNATNVATSEVNNMSTLPPQAVPTAPTMPSAPAAPTAPAAPVPPAPQATAPAAPTMPTAPTAPVQQAAPVQQQGVGIPLTPPTMPVMGGSEDDLPFVGGTPASAVPTPAPQPAEPEQPVFKSGNIELDALLNRDVSEMNAKERKEFIATVQGTLRAWQGWAQDPNLPATDKEMGERLIGYISECLAYAEAYKPKRTPAKKAAADPVPPTPAQPAATAPDPTLSAPQPAAPVQQPTPAPAPQPAASVQQPAAPQPASVTAPVEKQIKHSEEAPAKSAGIDIKFHASSEIETLVDFQQGLILKATNTSDPEARQHIANAYASVSEAIASLLCVN